jgi:hypothetical protein
MATDVTKVNAKEYWVELQPTEKGGRRAWQDRRTWAKTALPELTLMVHRWKEVDALPEGGSVKALLTLYDIDSTDARVGKEKAEDTVFGRVELQLTKTAAGIAASVVNKRHLVERDGDEKLEDFYLADKDYNLAKADFVVRVGKRRLLYQLSRAELHDEALDGTLEVGFTLEEGGEAGRVYRCLPPVTPGYVSVSEPIADMLSLEDRFSDPARRPSIKTEDAARTHEAATLAALPSGDADIDGLRFEKLLDGSMTRRQLIASMIQPRGKAMTCKTYEHFDGELDPKLHAKKDILSQEWTSGDIVKAYFLIHDIGILENNRKPLHYRANSSTPVRFRSNGSKVAVHGYMNWSGVYAPGWNFWQDKRGTVASFDYFAPNPPWAPFTIEFESPPIPFYRPGPAKYDDAVKAFNDPSSPYFDNVPERLEQGMDKSGATEAHEWACIGWKFHFEGWGDRAKAAKRLGKPKPKSKEKTLFFAASPKCFIDGIADLYLLASARAGHLLTITTHVEVDRMVPGAHDDPSGVDLQVLYDAITRRLSKSSPTRLPGLGGLEIPVGVRYGMHPRRLTTAPILWKGIPVSQMHAGNNSLSFPTEFPQQSSPPVPGKRGKTKYKVKVKAPKKKA